MKTSSLPILLLSTGIVIVVFQSLRIGLRKDLITPRHDTSTVEQYLAASLATETASAHHDESPAPPTTKTTTTTMTESSRQLRLPIIDILSIGSQLETKLELQKAQRITFGSHKAVRHFYGATEKDDTDSCYIRLTRGNVRQVVDFCHSRPRENRHRYPLLDQLSMHFISRDRLLEKANPVGWLCAQRRPFDGLLRMIGKYKYRSSTNRGSSGTQKNYNSSSSSSSSLPDYLLVMDDDTWVNLDQMIPFLSQQYPVETPHVVAGCLLVTKYMNFTLPFGGYGIFLNRKALENFLQPLYCGPSKTFGHDDDDDDTTTTTTTKASLDPWTETNFERLACWRLEQNLIGEKAVYREGMSIADLLYYYANDQPYVQVHKWNNVGFCMHSDWAWAYFINYYHIAQLQRQQPSEPDTTTTTTTTTPFTLSLSSNSQHHHHYHHAPPPHFASPQLHDRLVGYNHSHVRPWDKATTTHRRVIDGEWMRQCAHGNDIRNLGPNGDAYCTTNAHVCHRITPDHMHFLHSWNQMTFPDHYDSTRAR